MAVLKNPKHEAFAQAIAKGKTADEAYQIAGYKPNRGNASVLKAKQNIADRVAEIVRRGADRAEASVEKVLREMARLSFSDLRRAFDENGNLKRLEDLDDDTAAAIASIEVVTRSIGDGEVERVHKIRTWDKNSALDKLAKYFGMFVEKHEIKSELKVSHVRDEIARKLDLHATADAAASVPRKLNGHGTPRPPV